MKKRHGYTESAVGLEYSHKFTCPLMPAIQPNKEYDLAVSFLTPHYFVAQKVRAKKKNCLDSYGLFPCTGEHSVRNGHVECL